jgi:multidrug efflux system membrane fusion protein
VEAGQALLDDGLEDGVTVVVEGTAKLQPGAHITTGGNGNGAAEGQGKGKGEGRGRQDKPQ